MRFFLESFLADSLTTSLGRSHIERTHALYYLLVRSLTDSLAYVVSNCSGIPLKTQIFLDSLLRVHPSKLHFRSGSEAETTTQHCAVHLQD
jgi:hypothetical protein